MVEKQSIVFTSLGTLFLDDVYSPTGKVVKDVLGGSGPFACFGARLFSPGSLSKSIGFTVRRGNDFPLQTLRLLENLNITLQILDEPDHPTSRGDVHYLDSALSTKTFTYSTPALPLEPRHLIDTTLLESKVFHLFCDPDQAIEQVAQLCKLRTDAGIFSNRPLFIWEPKAYCCSPEYLERVIDAMRVVDVFSPNHVELAGLINADIPTTADEDTFDQLCKPLMSNDESLRGGMVVVRAAEMGCFVKSRAGSVILPAYHSLLGKVTENSPSEVVDTTGAGNSFLGAFAVELMRSSGDVIRAACAGNVAASFVVEQIGLPAMKFSEEGVELWNGEEVLARMTDYKVKLNLD